MLKPFALAMLLGLTACQMSEDAPGCSAPPSHWLKVADGIPAHRAANTLTLSAGGQIRWNGVVISRATLDAYMQSAAQSEPQPVVLFRADAAVACDKLRAFRRHLDAKPLCRNDRLCGEGTGWAYYEGDKVRL